CPPTLTTASTCNPRTSKCTSSKLCQLTCKAYSASSRKTVRSTNSHNKLTPSSRLLQHHFARTSRPSNKPLKVIPNQAKLPSKRSQSRWWTPSHAIEAESEETIAIRVSGATENRTAASL